MILVFIPNKLKIKSFIYINSYNEKLYIIVSLYFALHQMHMLTLTRYWKRYIISNYRWYSCYKDLLVLIINKIKNFFKRKFTKKKKNNYLKIDHYKFFQRFGFLYIVQI